MFGILGLVRIASKVLVDIILRWLDIAHKGCMHANQAGLRPGEGCINHISAQLAFECGRTFRGLKMSFLLWKQPFTRSMRQFYFIASLKVVP